MSGLRRIKQRVLGTIFLNDNDMPLGHASNGPKTRLFDVFWAIGMFFSYFNSFFYTNDLFIYRYRDMRAMAQDTLFDMSWAFGM